MSASSSSSSSTPLSDLKCSYISCLEDIAGLLANMDSVVESLELGSGDPSSVGTLQELLKELEDSLSELKAFHDVDLPPDYEDPPEDEVLDVSQVDEC